MSFYNKLKFFVFGLAITLFVFSFIYIGTRPAAPATKPVKSWKLVSAVVIPQLGPDIEATLGQAHEVNIDGCNYLIWIAPDKRSGNMLHKGNCPNHGIKVPEEPKTPEQNPGKIQI